MSVRKQILKIDSKYLNSMTTVGTIIPEKTENIMILLHGYNGSFKQLDDNLPLREYAADNKMLIAVPDMNNGYYMNKPDYQVKEFFLFEFLPKIQETYGTNEEIPKYIAGISMGGYGSLLIGSALSSQFKKIISISGALIAHDVVIGNPQIVGMPGDQETWKYFTDTFAPFETLERDPERNPVGAVLRKGAEVPEIIMTCGTKDMLCSRNAAVLQRFDKYKVNYVWRPVEGGLHNYTCFDEGLRYALKML